LYPLLAQAGFQFFATEEFGDFVSDFDSLAVGSKDLREREGGGEGKGRGWGVESRVGGNLVIFQD
jgi:hypothetical protein